MARNPRPYQIEAFDSCRNAFRNGVKGVVVEHCTGAGKTVVFSLIAQMAREKNKRVLILMNRDVLIGQSIEELQENGVYCQREQAGDRAAITADVVVASVASMQKEWIGKYRPGYFDIVITDECHGSRAQTFRNILDHHSESYHVGFTATAERHDKKALWKGYEKIVHSLPLYNHTDAQTGIVTPGAINLGWLCNFQFNELPVPITLDDAVAMGKKISEAEECEQFEKNDYLPRLFYEASHVAKGKKGLAFWPGCSASERAAKEMRDNGINARHIDGYMTIRERKSLLDWFRDCKEGVLCNSDLLLVGYNQPDINWLLMGRIFRSLPMWKQGLGRGSRSVAPVDYYSTPEERLACIAASLKPHCEVWDLMIQNENHNLATPSCLITDDAEERQILNNSVSRGTQVSLADLEDKLKSKRLVDADKQLERLANDAANAAEKVRHKFKEPYIRHITRIVGKPEWKPISSGQEWKLRNVGYSGPLDGLYSFHARKIIDVYLKHKQKQMA